MTSSTVGKDDGALRAHNEKSDVTEGSGTKLADDDREYMGSPEDAKTALAEKAKAWRQYRQPVMATRAALKQIDAKEREAQFQLANAALLWLWHEENPAQPGDTPSADGGESLSTSSLNTSSLPQITSIDARVKELETALETAIRVADEAREEWDKAPSGMKAGKLLIALSDPSLKYRADITAMHAARLSQGSPGQ